MKKIKKISLKNLIIIVFLIAVSKYWFTDIQNIGLDMDEVYYILSSQFYLHRKNENMKAFSLPADFRKISWSSLQYQTIDQPQLGKYIIGFILDFTDSNPWNSKDQSWLYAEFARFKLPSGKSLNQLHDYLGSEMISAIITIRYASTIASLISLLLFGFVVAKTTNNSWIGLMAFTSSTFSPLLRQFLRIATTNSFSLLSLIISSVFIIYLFKIFKRASLLALLLASLSLGTLIAFAVSIKINGLFLLLFPLALIIIRQLLIWEKINLKNLYHKRSFLSLSGIITGFISSFFYLEPELWKNPLKGMLSLIGIRLAQQQRFILSYGKMSIPEAFQALFKLFLSISDNTLVKIILLSLFLIGVIKLINQSRKDNDKKTLLYFSMFSLSANVYYARVNGFDRYFIPGILIITLLSSIGLQQLTEFKANKFKKILEGNSR